MPKANRPHFHILKAAKPRKPGLAATAWFRLARTFNSNPAAFQWAKRNHPDARFMVQKCEEPECRPSLD